VLVLVVASYLFRLPPLLNARSTNSDAAVVGLQAIHILRGELSPFLWGSGYQTSADAFVAALFFLVLGPKPIALMLSALTLHVIATLLVFATVRRHFGPWTSLLLALPLVLSPSSVHTYALYPPRQLALTLALAALWSVDGAGATLLAQRDAGPVTQGRLERGARFRLALGGLLAALAISADPYPLLLLPVALVLAGLVSRDAFGTLAMRVGWFVAGGMFGFIPFVVLHRMARATGGQLGFTTDALGKNFDLLVSDCLPWALSYKVFRARDVMDYHPWAPLPFRVLGMAGALLVLAIVVYALVAIMLPAISWRTRSLGFAAALGYPLALVAFLGSVMVMDHFSMRYLVVLTLLLPFAATPTAHALGPRRFGLVITPHLCAAAIAGWVGYGPFVRGVVPVRETPELRDDYTLHAMLRARGVSYAMADYWASYRLTFLFREDIVVVPKNDVEDRYAPYRRAFQQARTYAYVYDPGRSREDLAEATRALRAGPGRVEELRAGRLSVFVVTRP
jgi:hypothetical protein